MRCSLTVAGVEVELVTRDTSLEAIISRRYSPYLGLPAHPDCSVRLELTPRMETSLAPAIALAALEGREDVSLGRADLPAGIEFAPVTTIRTPAIPGAIDRALQVIFAILGLGRDALMFNGVGTISDRVADVFTGSSAAWRFELVERAGRRPVMSIGCVIVREVGGVWVAAATPFLTDPVGPPRQAPLAQLWHPAPGPFACRVSERGAVLGVVIGTAVLPTTDPVLRRTATSLVSRLHAAVPMAALPSLAQLRPGEWVVHRRPGLRVVEDDLADVLAGPDALTLP